jgi:hypothetical protein
MPTTLLDMSFLNYTGQHTIVLPAGVWTLIPGMTSTLTPKSAASVIAVKAVMNGDRLLNNVPATAIRCLRNGVPIGNGVGAGVNCYGRLFTVVFFEPFLHVDSPITVLPCVYTFEAYNAAGNTIYLNTDSVAGFSGSSTLLLEEFG